MTTRRNFLRGLASLPVFGFIGCKTKKKVPAQDAPLDEWRGAQVCPAKGRLLPRPRVRHLYNGNILDYLDISPATLHCQQTRGELQKRNWIRRFNHVYFPGADRDGTYRMIEIARNSKPLGQSGPWQSLDFSQKINYRKPGDEPEFLKIIKKSKPIKPPLPMPDWWDANPDFCTELSE